MFISDSQPIRAQNLNYVGGIEYEEFAEAQRLKIAEEHLDYCGSFRWSSQQVKQKRVMLTPAMTVLTSNLVSILKQAFTAECGLVAFGD